MKNPNTKMLKIVDAFPTKDPDNPLNSYNYAFVLSNLAIAESNLVKAGKDSAMPHFLAIVKEIERVFGFKF